MIETRTGIQTGPEAPQSNRQVQAGVAAAQARLQASSPSKETPARVAPSPVVVRGSKRDSEPGQTPGAKVARDLSVDLEEMKVKNGEI